MVFIKNQQTIYELGEIIAFPSSSAASAVWIGSGGLLRLQAASVYPKTLAT